MGGDVSKRLIGGEVSGRRGLWEERFVGEEVSGRRG